MGLFTPSSRWNDDTHELFAENVQKFFQIELKPRMQNHLDEGVVERTFWEAAGQAGIMGGSVSEAYGGSGGDLGYDSIALYEQARIGDTSWGFGIQSIVTHYIVSYGSEDQKRRWLPGLISGELVGALAMTEPGGGSDLQAIKTKAEQDGNQYRINGSKIFITNGGSANLIILAAKTGPESGAKGMSLIAVETNGLDGFSRGGNLEKLGMRGNDTAELFFENAHVPLTNLLGPEEGQGFYQMMRQLPWERLLIGITALGAVDLALELTVDHVKQRKAFGKRIMDQQNTRFLLAEANTKTEIFRSFLNDCIDRLLSGSLDSATASMAKYWGSRIQNEIVDDCLQMFGGYGYMMEYPIARLYADARVQRIYGGTNEVMLELIARSIDS